MHKNLQKPPVLVEVVGIEPRQKPKKAFILKDFSLIPLHFPIKKHTKSNHFVLFQKLHVTVRLFSFPQHRTSLLSAFFCPFHSNARPNRHADPCLLAAAGGSLGAPRAHTARLHVLTCARYIFI